MSSNYSRREVESIVKQIQVEATEAGMLPAGAWMAYHPGNASNGISGYVDCIREDADGYHPVRVDFLPEFTYKMSKNDHARLLQATLRVFHALRRQREAV